MVSKTDAVRAALLAARTLFADRSDPNLEVLPERAGSHVAEAAVFPDLLISMSRKPPSSRTCWFACRGNRQLPGQVRVSTIIDGTRAVPDQDK